MKITAPPAHDPERDTEVIDLSRGGENEKVPVSGAMVGAFRGGFLGFARFRSLDS
jgi:hypothetical protein